MCTVSTNSRICDVTIVWDVLQKFKNWSTKYEKAITKNIYKADSNSAAIEVNTKAEVNHYRNILRKNVDICIRLSFDNKMYVQNANNFEH